DIDWRQVKEIHDSFQYSQSGLSGPAALAVAIAVSAFVGPTAVGALGSVGGAAATSLASQGAVNLINQQGDLGGALKDTLSRQGLEGAALASASAGVAQGMDRIWGGRTDVITQGVQGVDLASLEGIGRFAGSIGSRAAIDASLQTALQGGSLGDRLGDALHGTVGSVVAAAMFNAVGDYAEAQGYAEGSVEKVALHALAGGLASVASGGDFESGAIAAGANEALVGHLAEWLEQDPTLLTGAAQITGLVAAGLAGGDAQQGAWVAGQAVTYNYLRHEQFQEIADRLDSCDTDVCRQEVTDQALALSYQQDLEALALCSRQAAGCAEAVQASMTTPFKGIEFSNPRTQNYLAQLSWENPGKNAAFAAAAAGKDAAAIVSVLGIAPEQSEQATESLASMISGGVLGADRGGVGSRPSLEVGGKGTRNVSSGAENIATYPKLKDQLAQQNLANIAAQDSRLAAAVKGSGTANPNFSIGSGTAAEANNLGRIWVGDGARPISGVPGGLISADGSRVYRPPVAKPNTPAQYNPTGVQANFQELQSGKVISNGHLSVTSQ
ncbi:DUF637 domain-containing protein, partial [Halotalea alkalilenta]|uniref:DUF637 domain-containing protein n=1 Tax=Halotalea alkalilenta TaxID=376489 RepID=UPI0004835DBE